MTEIVAGIGKFFTEAVKYISVNLAWDKSVDAVNNHGETVPGKKTKFFIEVSLLAVAGYIIWESLLEPELERHHKRAITEAIADERASLSQHAVFPPKQVTDHIDRLRVQQNSGFDPKESSFVPTLPRP